MKITEIKNIKFAGLFIWENGESRELSLEELIELQNQGYKIEIKLIKPAIVKEVSMEFEIDFKEKEDD